MQPNEQHIDALNHYLSLGTIVVGIIAVLWLIILIANFNKREHRMLQKIARYAYGIGFFTSLVGMAGAIYYSYFLQIEPCMMCWYQRIFLFPQVFLFAYAWYKKDAAVFSYSILLSIFGLAIGVYQHVMQLGYSVYRPCSTNPLLVDCSIPTFIEFGFVTFPLMAAVLFAVLILSGVTFKKFSK